jgi:hypothetical protein
VALPEPDTESSLARAKRSYWAVVTGDKWAWLLLAICGLGVQGAGVYLGWGLGRSGASLVATVAGIVGYMAALLIIFVALVLSTLRAQRDEAREALQERLDQRPELIFKHRFRLPMLTIDVTVNGSTIRNAVMHLVVPRTVGRVWRVGVDNCRLSTGAVRWAETEIEDEEAIYWDERNVSLDGFGTINQFRFELWSFARDTGSIPFVFKIGSDLLGGWEEYAAAIKASRLLSRWFLHSCLGRNRDGLARSAVRPGGSRSGERVTLM